MIVGIAGRIGTGKSAGAHVLEEVLSAFYIDADAIVHELYEPFADGWYRVKAVFGGEFVDAKEGVLRDKLGDLVFADKNKLEELTSVIHPLVYERILNLLSEKKGENVVIEAFTFSDTMVDHVLDTVVYIECSKDLVFSRLREARGLEREKYERVVAIQERPPRIDFVLENEGSLDDFTAKMKALGVELLGGEEA